MAKINNYILVCGGTGCRASRSEEIIAALRRALDRTGESERTRVIRTGCFGFCEQGPIVKMIPDNTFYVSVKPEDAEEIVREHVVKGRKVERLLYTAPDTGQHVPDSKHMKFYKPQLRIALRNCGFIDPENIGEYIARAKDKNDSFKLMGFGHRVYKNFDPRAKLMGKVCADVLGELGLENDRLFKLAKELEKIALEDEYFVEKKLYPNVDFYSGIIMKAIGIPMSMFTVIFAISRTIGWIAHWNEMHSDPDQKIGRPRQLYTGLAQRDFTPLDQR